METPALQKGLSYVQQATELDNQGKYSEAIQYYNLGLEQFISAKSELSDVQLLNLIDQKSLEYKERINLLQSWIPVSSLDLAIDYAEKAVEQDNKGSSTEALTLYEKALENFLTAMNDSKQDKETHLLIQQKFVQYLERAEFIKSKVLSSPKPTTKQETTSYFSPKQKITSDGTVLPENVFANYEQGWLLLNQGITWQAQSRFFEASPMFKSALDYFLRAKKDIETSDSAFEKVEMKIEVCKCKINEVGIQLQEQYLSQLKEDEAANDDESVIVNNLNNLSSSFKRLGTSTMSTFKKHLT